MSNVVPGMAEAIEQRRQEKGLSPTEFAKAAGITVQGLRPVRLGERRRYRHNVRIGVARALDWPDDALERLMAGEVPAPLEPLDPATAAWLNLRLDRLEAQLGDVLSELQTLARRRREAPE